MFYSFFHSKSAIAKVQTQVHTQKCLPKIYIKTQSSKQLGAPSFSNVASKNVVIQRLVFDAFLQARGQGFGRRGRDGSTGAEVPILVAHPPQPLGKNRRRVAKDEKKVAIFRCEEILNFSS